MRVALKRMKTHLINMRLLPFSLVVQHESPLEVTAVVVKCIREREDRDSGKTDKKK